MRVFRCHDIRLLVLCVSLYLFARLFVQMVIHMTCPIVATEQISMESMFPGSICDRHYNLRVVKEDVWKLKCHYEAAMWISAFFVSRIQCSNNKTVFLYIRFYVPSLSLPRSGLL